MGTEVADALIETFKQGRKIYTAIRQDGRRVVIGNTLQAEGKEWELVHTDKDSVLVFPKGSADPFDAQEFAPSVFGLTIREEIAEW